MKKLHFRGRFDKSNHNQNFPNPFNRTTKIRYSVTNPGFVSLIVYDVTGREVQTLVNEFQETGTHSSNFDASSLNANTYFYKLEVGNTVVETKRMILIR